MRTFVAAAAVTVGLGAAPASSATYTALYAFGDSLSDVGNVYAASGIASGILPGGPWPLPAYYTDGVNTGRFTNGLNWVDDLSAKLGLGTVGASINRGGDFAVGGAQTGPTVANTGATNLFPGVPLVDLDQQVQTFKTLDPSPAAGALYTLDIGANDIGNFLGSPFASETAAQGVFLQQAVANTVNAVSDLYDDGARSLLYYEVPDLSLVPDFKQYGANAGALAQAFNTDVLAGLEPLEAKGLAVFDVPIFSDLQSIAAHPGAYGLANVTDPCFSGDFRTAGSVCSDPGSYLFWDGEHPTAAAHAITAEVAYDVLEGIGAPVGDPAAPEPSTWLLMLAGFAGLGVVHYRSSRRRAAAG